MNVPGDPNLAAALASVQAATAGMTRPIEPADPRMTPIEDVTFEQFVAVSAASIRTPPATTAGADELAQAHDVPAGRWQAIQSAWNARMSGDFQLARHFGSALMATGAMAGASGVAGSPALAGPVAPPRTDGAGAAGDDMVARLARLGTLHASGALTDEEFARLKASLIEGV